jgi:MFS family permease
MDRAGAQSASDVDSSRPDAELDRGFESLSPLGLGTSAGLQADDVLVRRDGRRQFFTAPLRLAPTWRLPRTFSALRYHNFRLYWFGQMISLAGTWMQSVAQGWLVYELTHSPFALGLVGFAASLPVLLFSLFGGVLADRVNRRSLLVATQTLSMIQAFLLAGLTFTGLVQVWHVILLAFTLGAINAFDNPARQAFVVEMVDREDLMNAIALNSTVFNLARVLGPAIAGALLALVGVTACFFLNGVSFLAVIAGLLAMNLRPTRRPARIGSMWTNLADGLRYIRADPTVLTLIALVAVIGIFGMPYATLMPIFADQVLHVGEQGYGFLLSMMGLGALIGALGVASLGNFRHKGWLLTAGDLLFPAMLLLFSLSRSFVVSAFLLMGVGAALVSRAATTNTLVQTMIPDELRGRVMSVYTMMFLGMTPLGAFQAGVVANWSSAPFAVGYSAVVCGLSALLVLWLLPQVRRLE